LVSRKRDSGRRAKKRNILALLIILFCVLLVSVAIYSIYYFLFMENNTIVPAFDETRLNLVIEDEIVISPNQPYIIDGEILLPFDVVKKYIDPHIYWDSNLKKVTITTKDRVIRMETGNLDALVNNKEMVLSIPVTEKDGEVYIPIEFLADFYNIELNHLKDNNVIIVDFVNRIIQLAEPIDVKAVVRKGRSIKYPIIKKFDFETDNPEDISLRIFEEYKDWYKVRTAGGEIGFVEKKYVVVKKILVNSLPELESKDTAWKPENGKINLVWEMMYGKRPDLSSIDKMDGLDVISPTWFQLENDKGKLINRADSAYVEWAHKNGHKVWALFSNDFNDIKMTERFLNNTDSRDNAIREVLAYAALYKLDGINIDFENIYKKDKDIFTQFVREITPLLREQGLVVSVDVSIPDGSDTWSLCYDREALGEVVDYVALMTYDQHWASSPIAGSVAEITWVEKNLKKVLELVPKEKLLLGMPFYTRLWQEERDNDGKIKVTSPRVFSMDAAKQYIQENNAQTVWDEKSGQFYAEFSKDGSTFKIWLEDVHSINLKSSLVQKYKLAGAASWQRTYETSEVWSVLNKNLKSINSFQEWKAENSHIKYASGN
jgi:spore germination protein YaaH